MLEPLHFGANRLAFLLLVAFGVAAALARALAPIALRIGLADPPGGRKQHLGTIPITGGVAMYAGFAAGALASGLVAGPVLALVAALGLMIAGGAADDMHDISPRAKFLFQLTAALFMTSWAGVQVTDLGDLLGFGPAGLYGWALPFSVVCALGVINALNMVDGLDGAAGGVALVVALWLAGCAAAQALAVQTVLLLLLAAAIAGFLVWNLRTPLRRQAAVFMGDAGSMMLGLALCWFSIDLTQGPGHTLPPITCVWLLAVPLLDMARVIFLRLRRGASLFGADRGHFHHWLLARGYSEPATAWLLVGASALSGAIGVCAWRFGVPDWAMFYAFLALLAAVLAWSAAERGELGAGGEDRG
jgi:UDP-GlcNAc:undecaprenyl-phosphate/decaprenyl-phosphate GlcNAc-1-phosphate transferase